MNKNTLKICDINHLDIQKATNNHIDNMHKNSPDKIIKKNSLEDNIDDIGLKKRKKRNRKKKKKTEDQSQSELLCDKDKSQNITANQDIANHDHCNTIDTLDHIISDKTNMDINIDIDIDIDIDQTGEKMNRNEFKTNLLNNLISIKTMDAVKLPEHRGFSEESIQYACEKNSIN